MSEAAAPVKRSSYVYRLAVALGLLVILLFLFACWFYFEARGSLPRLSGKQLVEGISSPVIVYRDQLGIPTIEAENRPDAAFSLGFVHAQDRFFQMDGMRRFAAGEISELLGSLALSSDKELRLHRFRMRAHKRYEALSRSDRTLLEAYASGVNSGLASLSRNPFEYAVLRIDPAEWLPEDTFLVFYFMYLALQGSTPELESTLGVMKEMLPVQLFDFLVPNCTEWDVPLTGEPCQPAPIPSSPYAASLPFGRGSQKEIKRAVPLMPIGLGSNNWAVGARWTAHGGALLANDMHLGMYVPNTWYRASLVYEENGERVSVSGVTLPGGPAVVVGSNTNIAWGFTNSMGDWADLVVLEPGPGDDSYLTPGGARPYERVLETIRVRFGQDEEIEILTTIWGPLFDKDYKLRHRALRWVAHDSEAVNLGLVNLETAATVQEAIEIATRIGIPTQNFTVVDSEGNIGWTLAGPMPRRQGHDGRVPISWADGTCGWDGWLPSHEYPRVVNPETGRIWTANARVVGGKELRKIGDGGYRFAARARQIREGLLKLETAREVDMLKIQLDDRALFMESWRELLLETLTRANMAADPRLGEVRRYVENWEGRTTVDSVGYRIIRLFHDRISEEVFAWLLEPCLEADQRIDYGLVQDKEAPLLQLVRELPPEFLHPSYESWQELFLMALEAVLSELAKNGSNLGDRTWGEQNTVQSHHPLSQLFFPFERWLDMIPQPLPGDRFVPRVQTPLSGASERMVVSPGREEEGILHMPCGQSGHPLSPHYSDGHAAWAKGEPTSFLPGPPANTMTLLPLSNAGRTERDMK